MMRPREVRFSVWLDPALLGLCSDLLNGDFGLMFQNLDVGCLVTGIGFK